MSESDISDDVDQLIHVLPDILANKIAAGEVVERPASAVKELVENSIDAGASRIEIRLMASGNDLVEVIDDGCGMSATDADLAFIRHATSKIKSIEDLERVRTLGFRGEAVASIAAVSRASIRTKRKSDQSGIEVKVVGGEYVARNPIAAVDGTTVSVRDLFFNVPARRKFLKAPTTEFRRIVEVVEALSLSHPDISFALSNDGKGLIDVAGAVITENSDPLLERIIELFGFQSGEDLFRVSEETSYLSVSGYVGKASISRKSRGRQYLFVNGRSVKSRYLDHAVRNAYHGLLQEGQHPFFVLFLDLDPSHVDVNVHPTKAEVKFDDERGVYSLIRTIVAKRLSEADLAPIVDESHDIRTANWRFTGSDELDRNPAPAVGYGHPQSRSGQRPGDLSELLYGEPATGIDVESDAESGLFLDREKERPVDIWQIDERYLVVQLRQGILLIEQNAAHERVLYERAIESLKGVGGFSQQLLFPKTLEFSASDFALVENLVPDLRTLGFDIDLFGGRSVLLRGVPTGVKDGAAESLLYEVVGQFRELHSGSSDSQQVRRENLARSIARKSAVKAGESLSQMEMRGLVDQLLVCENPWKCPSGKTAIVRIGIGEFLKLLDR